MRATTRRFLIMALSAMAAVAIPAITAGSVEASSHHVRKHHQRTTLDWNSQVRRSWVQPVAPGWSGTGDICPGNARAIDCKIWPPPIDVDPDRKASGADGAG